MGAAAQGARQVIETASRDAATGHQEKKAAQEEAILSVREAAERSESMLRNRKRLWRRTV